MTTIFKSNNIDSKCFLSLMMILAVVIGHITLGYPLSFSVSVILTVSYITLFVLRRTWLVVSWVVLVIASYAFIDIVTYNQEGTSAILYNYMLSITLAQLYGILLCFACTKSRHRSYKNETISTSTKIKNIKTTLSIYGLYALPTSVAVCGVVMYSAFNSTAEYANLYFIFGLVSIIILAGLHFASYAEVLILTRAIEKSIKKEDDNNEVLKESSNGESIRQGDT